jgi:CubicO group peptidase (beta-lactamase class C family)
MRRIRWIVVFVSLAATMLVFVGSTRGRVQDPARSESPAVRRARELVAVINEGNYVRAVTFVKETYSESFLKMPLEDHLEFIMSVHDLTQGIESVSVQAETADSVTILGRSRLTGQSRALEVRVETAPPNKIARIGFRPPAIAAGAKTQSRLTDSQLSSELGLFVKKLADADVFSGAVLVAKNGEVLFKQAYGDANKDFDARNRVDTKFNLGSMNKMFTSIAIAQLVERGKVSLDDPLSKYVPDFPTREWAEKIKIKHLLSHTSGLGSYFNRKFMESSRARFRTVDDMMTLAVDERPQFEPGTKWAYSNTGMLVLGKVIEKATGQTYFDYIRENIYRPAGMINSDCYELDTVNKNLAVGYSKVFTEKGTTFRNNIFEHVMRGGPAGGGYSTVEDLYRFSQALMGGKLVKPELVKLFTSAKPELNSPNYGYGFQIDATRRTIGHSGGFPGISSNLSIFLDSGYVTVVMSNYGRGSDPIDRKIEEMLAGNE